MKLWRRICLNIFVLMGIFAIAACGAAGVKSGSSSAAIFITTTSQSLSVGSSQNIVAVGTDQASVDISSTVNWSSSSPTVATISTSGVVTGISEGTTTVTASLNGVVSNSLILTVRSASNLSLFPLVTSQSSGTSQQLTALVTFTNGSTQILSDAVTWTSSNAAVLSISSTGLATANSMGIALVSATYNGLSSNNTLTITVTNSALTVSSLVIMPGKLVLVNGVTQQLSATAIYSDGTTSVVTSYATWSSSNSAAATVTSTGGLLSTVSNGTGSVSAAYGGVTGSQFFIVKSAYKYLYSNTASTLFTYCSLSAAGALSACGTTGSSYLSSTPNIYGNYVYAENNNGATHQIISCSINSGTGALSGCANSGGSGWGASNMLRPAFYGSSWAYTAVGSNVYQCPLNMNAGTLGACSLAGQTLNIGSPALVVTNGNYLYLPQAGGGNYPVVFCPINPSTGALNTCSTTSLAFNATGLVFAGNYAYLAPWSASYIIVCTVNANGDLYPCSTTGTNITASVTVATDGSLLFIANRISNLVTACTINFTTGALSGCTTSASGNANLSGIGVY